MFLATCAGGGARSVTAGSRPPRLRSSNRYPRGYRALLCVIFATLGMFHVKPSRYPRALWRRLARATSAEAVGRV